MGLHRRLERTTAVRPTRPGFDRHRHRRIFDRGVRSGSYPASMMRRVGDPEATMPLGYGMHAPHTCRTALRRAGPTFDTRITTTRSGDLVDLRRPGIGRRAGDSARRRTDVAEPARPADHRCRSRPRVGAKPDRRGTRPGRRRLHRHPRRPAVDRRAASPTARHTAATMRRPADEHLRSDVGAVGARARCSCRPRGRPGRSSCGRPAAVRRPRGNDELATRLEIDRRPVRRMAAARRRSAAGRRARRSGRDPDEGRTRLAGGHRRRPHVRRRRCQRAVAGPRRAGGRATGCARGRVVPSSRVLAAASDGGTVEANVRWVPALLDAAVVNGAGSGDARRGRRRRRRQRPGNDRRR